MQYSRLDSIRPPRPMQMRKDAPNIGCMQLFLIPHTLVGVGVFCFLLFTISAILWGTDAEVTVARKWTSRGSKNSTNYHVAYTSNVEGVPPAGEVSVNSDEYGRLNAGDRLLLRHHRWGPFEFLQSAKGLWSMALFLAVFDAFWIGILSVFYWVMYGQRLLQANLVRSGLPAPGRITAVEHVMGKPPSVRLRYAYTPPGAGEMQGAMSVAPARAKGTQIGEAVTILYAPASPARSCIYEYGLYEV